jgi:hypothetical protein
VLVDKVVGVEVALTDVEEDAALDEEAGAEEAEEAAPHTNGVGPGI